MMEFDEEVKSILAEMRVRITETAYNHITTAISLFDSYSYSQACFFAITAIEEMGKARTLQMVQSDIYTDKEPTKIDASGIQSFLREHRLKALRAAASGLSANHGAVRRHGRHEDANLNLSSGVLLLAKSNKWMDVRNSCVYTDANIVGKSMTWPAAEISAHHAYYFICMGMEILAEEAEAGFGSPIEGLGDRESLTDFNTAAGFRSSVLSLLEQFMLSYEGEFDPDELEFFIQDQRYDDLRDEIREREVDPDIEKREKLQKAFTEDIAGANDIDDDDLPEGLDAETYQSSIINDMVDVAMDAPYFTPQELHPDLEDLSEHVQQYVEY